MRYRPYSTYQHECWITARVTLVRRTLGQRKFGIRSFTALYSGARLMISDRPTVSSVHPASPFLSLRTTSTWSKILMKHGFASLSAPRTPCLPKNVLQDLKLSNSPHLTNAAVASIVSSECGRNTLRVLELGRCPGIGGSALALVMPPALPALVRFGWWGAAGDVGEEALNRGGTCWIISGC